MLIKLKNTDPGHAMTAKMYKIKIQTVLSGKEGYDASGQKCEPSSSQRQPSAH